MNIYMSSQNRLKKIHKPLRCSGSLGGRFNQLEVTLLTDMKLSQLMRKIINIKPVSDGDEVNKIREDQINLIKENSNRCENIRLYFFFLLRVMCKAFYNEERTGIKFSLSHRGRLRASALASSLIGLRFYS